MITAKYKLYQNDIHALIFKSTNFSIIQNSTNTSTSNIHIRWSNTLKINSRYYVKTSILSENAINTVSTDNAYVDLMMRPGVSYTIYVTTYCCKNLIEIGNFQITCGTAQ